MMIPESGLEKIQLQGVPKADRRKSCDGFVLSVENENSN